MNKILRALLWLGNTTNSGECIIATKDNNGKIFHTRSLTRMTADQQWNMAIFDSSDIPQMDTTMDQDYTEEDDTGKAIIEQYSTKA
eukprot:4666235-Amphidinium_carterae.1